MSLGHQIATVRGQRPRVTLNIPEANAYNQQSQQQPSPYIMSAATMSGVPSQGQPANWNPFIQQMYSQRAGDFMCKQFEGLNRFTRSGLSVGEKSVVWIYTKFRTWSKKWFTHCFLIIVMLLYSVAGAAIFMSLEGEALLGPPEDLSFEDVRKEKFQLGEIAKDLSTNMEKLQNSKDWEQDFQAALGEYDKVLYDAFKKGQFDGSGEQKKKWTWPNALFFCGTVYTTIGYGHISPVTYWGRIFTIIYAIIGIPIFLILLTDFGKLFTRIIKFVWIFVRRLYYTGSCRKVRKTAPAQDVMRGLNVMYDFMRRPSMAFMDPQVLATLQQQRANNPTSPTLSVPLPGESPLTPLPTNLETYEVDDEFNLPISVAFTMLVAYMIFGASIYCIWEGWSFFEAFYFVFISISTIGFGDIIPSHPIFMMASIVYLIFGLALTSMCINVVQLKLSDHFRQASTKIMGQQLAEAASQGSAPQSPGELQSVNGDNNGAIRSTNDTPTTDKNTVNSKKL